MTQMKTSSDEMKVAIIANGKPQSRRVASKLFNAFRDDPDFYLTKKNPDVVISIGGDGMLLSAFHMYEKELARVRFVGIHTGHLGFYTDYLDSEVDQLIETLRKDSGAKISYPLLNVKLTLADGRSFTSIALNEAAIKRNEKTMAADVCLNDVLFESFRGDGLSVSTPTGSTAYNKSLGGAVLHPAAELLCHGQCAPGGRLSLRPCLPLLRHDLLCLCPVGPGQPAKADPAGRPGGDRAAATPPAAGAV